MGGTIQGSVTLNHEKFKFYIEWSTIQNISKNYSDVTVKSYWAPQSGWETWDFDTTGERDASITINGNTSYISKVFYTGDNWSNGNPYLIQSSTQRVYHDNDGTKSITISARANGRASEYGPSDSIYSDGDCIASGTIKLDTIPRASSITFASDITLGNSCNITWTPASDDFKYKIKFSLGDWYHITDYILPNTTNSYTYNKYIIPETEIYEELPDTSSGTMIATLTTYNSNEEQIGLDASKEFTVIIQDSIKPIIGNVELKPMDIEGMDHNYLVQNQNGLEVIIKDCKAGAGSKIKSYEVSGPSLSKIEYTSEGGITIVSSSVETYGTLTYTVKITDARGRTNSISKEIECYEYYVPLFKSFNAYRSDEYGNIDMNGLYLKCEYSIDYAPVNSTNSAVVTIYYNDFSIESDEPIDLNGDTTTTYKVHAKVIDAYGKGNTSSIITVFGETRILNVTKDGTSIAIGKMAEDKPDGYEGMFECRWPIKADSTIDASGPINTGDAAQTMKNLSYKQNNIVDVIDDDSTSNWIAQGNLATTLYSEENKINDQPSHCGFLLNITDGPNGSEVHNIWAAQPNGDLFHRGGDVNGWSGTWKHILDSSNCDSYTLTPLNCNSYVLTPSNYTDYASPKPVVLWEHSSGSDETISLNDDASNYNYMEIFFTDNNRVSHSSTKIVEPNWKTASLSLIDPGGLPEYTYIRRTNYTISGSKITPNVASSGYVRIDGNAVAASDFGTNYIRIVKVLGYKE